MKAGIQLGRAILKVQWSDAQFKLSETPGTLLFITFAPRGSGVNKFPSKQNRTNGSGNANEGEHGEGGSLNSRKFCDRNGWMPPNWYNEWKGENNRTIMTLSQPEGTNTSCVADGRTVMNYHELLWRTYHDKSHSWGRTKRTAARARPYWFRYALPWPWQLTNRQPGSASITTRHTQLCRPKRVIFPWKTILTLCRCNMSAWGWRPL